LSIPSLFQGLFLCFSGAVPLLVSLLGLTEIAIDAIMRAPSDDFGSIWWSAAMEVLRTPVRLEKGKCHAD
jgi:hypothetical protein